MNIFETLEMHYDKWIVKETRKFSDTELELISSAIVVASEYGNSVCFYLKSGGQCYIPLSYDSNKAVGEPIDPKEVKLITLSKPRESDIVKVKV